MLAELKANEAQYKQVLSEKDAAMERQQAEIAHNNELIDKFKHKPKKAAFAR